MISKIGISIKSFFSKQTLIKIIIAILAYFAPLQPLLLATIVFCFADFITGVFAARKKSIKEGKTNWGDWWNSKKMQKKIFDVIFYLVALLLSFYFQKLLIEEMGYSEEFKFDLSRLVAFIILSVEFWSNMENLATITGLPLGKDAFFQLANKLRGATNNQEQNNQ